MSIHQGKKKRSIQLPKPSLSPLDTPRLSKLRNDAWILDITSPARWLVIIKPYVPGDVTPEPPPEPSEEDFFLFHDGTEFLFPDGTNFEFP